MKLRIYENKIRLRLSRPEVEQFSQGASCTDMLVFPNGNTFTYKLAEGTDNLVSYDHDVMTIVLCEEEVETWANTDQVGIKAVVSSKSGKIDVLVEKDFQCSTNETEDQSDLFPNPKDC